MRSLTLMDELFSNPIASVSACAEMNFRAHRQSPLKWTETCSQFSRMAELEICQAIRKLPAAYLKLQLVAIRLWLHVLHRFCSQMPTL